MAFYLPFDGVDDYVSIPPWTPANADNWSFEALVALSSNISVDQTIFGKEFRVKLFVKSGYMGILHSSAWSTGGLIQAPVTADTTYLVRGEFDGTDIRLYFNDVLVASASSRNLAAQQGFHNTESISALGSKRLSSGSIVYSVKFYDDATQTNLSRHYNPTLSAETGGTLLIDEVGGNHGTLVNFSANPFVEYFDFLTESVDEGLRDYALTVDGYAADQYVELPLNYTAPNNCRLTVKFTPQQTNDNYMRQFRLTTGTTGNTYAVGFRKDGKAYVQSKNSTATSANAVINFGEVNTLTFAREGQTSTTNWGGMNFYCNGALIATRGTPIEDIVSFVALARRESYRAKYQIHSVAYSDDNGEEFFLDFDRAGDNTFATELLQGRQGTLVNFPSYTGNVRAIVPSNGVTFDGVNDYVQVDINHQSGNSDPIWNLKFKLANPDTTASFIRVTGNNTVADSQNRILISGSGNEFRYYRNGTQITWSITSNPATDIYELNVAGSLSGVELLINGVSQGFQNVGSAIGITHDLLGVNFNTYYKGGFEYVIFTTPDDPALNRFYDFTLTDNNIVPDTIGGNNGTLVGFDSVIYAQQANNEVVGYRFNGATSSARLADYDTSNLTDFELIIDFSLPDTPDDKDKLVGGATYAPFPNSPNFYVQYLNSNPNYGFELVCIPANNQVFRSTDNYAPHLVSLNTKYRYRITYNKTTQTVSWYSTEDGQPEQFVADLVGIAETAFDGTLYAARSGVDGQYTTSKVGKFDLYHVELTASGHTDVYDITTGDSDEFINLNGNHATIINTPTSGYLPVIPTQIYTVGTGNRDYADVSLWGQDNQIRDGDFHPVALCYGTQLLTDDVDIHSGFLHGYTIEGATGNFTGDFNDPNVAKITNDPAWTSWLFDDRIGRGIYKNIILEAGDNEVFYRESFAGGKFERCGLTRKTEGLVITHKTVGTTTTFNQCVVANPNASAGSQLAYFGRNGDPNNRQVQIYDTVFYGNTDATYGLVALWNVVADIYNSIFYNEGSALAINETTSQNGLSTFTGDNNLSNTIDDVQASTRRGSANELGIGESNVDFTGAFVDTSNHDYRINQTYADNNLVGAGFLGSDIAPWSYYDDSAAGNSYSLTLNSASMSLAGQVVGAKADRLTTVDSGLMAGSGISVSLKAGRVITPQTSSVSIAGQSIALNYSSLTSYVLPIDSGASSTSGQSVYVRADRVIATESGSITINGQSFSLTYNPLTGYVLAIDSGAINTSGQGITTLADRVLQPQQGNASLLGNVIDFAYHRALKADSGSASVTGQESGFLYNRFITLDEGYTNITGAAVTLDYSGFIALRIDGYSIRYEQKLIQPTYSQSFVTARYN